MIERPRNTLWRLLLIVAGLGLLAGLLLRIDRLYSMSHAHWVVAFPPPPPRAAPVIATWTQAISETELTAEEKERRRQLAEIHFREEEMRQEHKVAAARLRKEADSYIPIVVLLLGILVVNFRRQICRWLLSMLTIVPADLFASRDQVPIRPFTWPKRPAAGQASTELAEAVAPDQCMLDSPSTEVRI
jgi:hypothetical protein